MKRCKLCGELFEPKVNAQRICNKQHYRTCKVCGKQFPINRPSDSAQCCSKECTVTLRERTMKDRYGVAHALQSKHFLDKAESTQLAKYGVKHAAQNVEIKNKTRSMFREKYGVDTPFQLPDFQLKSTNTCLTKYGVAFTSQIPGRTEKMQKTNVIKYGSPYPLGNEAIRSKVVQHMQDTYGVPYFCMTDKCRNSQRQVISGYNKEFMRKLSDRGVPCTPEAVKLNRFSYDIQLDGTNILIEINPTYTHNAIGNHWGEGLHKYYHRDKTRLAAENGYRCINVWDWDNTDKILHLLMPKQPVYARKCEIHSIEAKSAAEFERRYHLQGSVKSQEVCLGLFYNEELVQVMTFGKPRYNQRFEWELLRLCSAFGAAVVGGAEKLWHHFIQSYHPQSVISYCDLSKFDGSVYSRIGMTLDEIVEPNKVWSKGEKVITNNLLLQRGYDQLFGTSFGKNTSNESLMINDGWLPVYDCGQARYVWRS